LGTSAIVKTTQQRQDHVRPDAWKILKLVNDYMAYRSKSLMSLQGIFVVQEVCQAGNVCVIGILQQASRFGTVLSQYTKCPCIKCSDCEMAKIFSDAFSWQFQTVQASGQCGDCTAREAENEDLCRVYALTQQVY